MIKKSTVIIIACIWVLILTNVIITVIYGKKNSEVKELYALTSADGQKSVSVIKDYGINGKYHVILKNGEKVFSFFTDEYSKDCHGDITDEGVYLCIDEAKGIEYFFEWGDEDE